MNFVIKNYSGVFMLSKLYIDRGYRNLDLNCSESMVAVANEAYSLGLDTTSLRLSSAFGGGMCVEEKCGAVTGALMVLGVLFVKERAHSTDSLKEIVRHFLYDFESRMQSCDCRPLKDLYRSEETGCMTVIESSLDILEETIEKYSNKRVR